MFKRLLLEEHTALCLTIALVTASTIFFGFLWRALRMSRGQVNRFSQLPFGSDADARHDSSV
ncbi:MAG TPA: hypothetical protein VEQ65_05785 [Opitutus sp.]|nr:hypothetical protein [Opitutus sp.]